MPHCMHESLYPCISCEASAPLVLLFMHFKIFIACIMIFLQIQKCDVDGYAQSGCAIELLWKGSGEIVPLSHKVVLIGAKPPRDFFYVSYYPERQTNSPVS